MNRDNIKITYPPEKDGFFNDLKKFMTSGPVFVQVLEGEGALGMPMIVNLQESGLGRSARIAGKSPEGTLKQSVLTTLFCFGAILSSAATGTTAAFTAAQSAAYQFKQANENFDSTCNGILYHVYSAAKEANESYTFKEMLN